MSDDLSRLYDGELDPAEADALRARIAADPALAARWAVMVGLGERLRALPKEVPVPEGLGAPPRRGPGVLQARGEAARSAPSVGADRRGPREPAGPPATRVPAPAPPSGPPRAGVPADDLTPLGGEPPLEPSPGLRPGVRPADGRVGGSRGDPSRGEGAPALPRPFRRALPWLGWAAAAALAVVALRPDPVRVLVAGTELVDGRARVLAGDVRVDVDGRARVTVEPPAARGREVPAEIDDMNLSHLVAALAGSVVTVTVMEGAAWLHADDAPPTRVEPGETRSVGADEAAAARGDGGERGADDRTASRGRARTARLGSAEDQVASLERDVSRLEREKALATARLRRHEGQPSPWPADVPGAYRPDAFERFVEERVDGLPDAEIAAVDCDEYPCVAVLQSHSDAPDWEDGLRGLGEGLDGAGFGERLHVVGMASEARSEEGSTRLYAFAVAPADLPEDSRARLELRATAALRDLATELAPSPAGE